MPTILLIDYEPLQGSLHKSILERQSPSVRRVADATQALCLIEQPPFVSDLALVISGSHGPGMGGPAFVAELLARLPCLPILVLGASGESAVDYPGASVRFLPRWLCNEEMLTAASRAMMHYEYKTA